MSVPAASSSAPAQTGPAEPVASTSALPTTGAAPRKRRTDDADREPLSEIMFRRTTTIKEGDNVLLRLPSDQVKAVVAAKDGLVHLGKFGSFPASELLGLHYDITYEIYPDPSKPLPDKSNKTSGGDDGTASGSYGQGKSKKQKKQAAKEGGVRSNPGWSYLLRPLKRAAVADLIIDDITETNEFIDDSEAAKQELLSQEEIAEMRAKGASAEDIMHAQQQRHERFKLKTEFSKEKWRKRKEKKYLQSIHPLSPSAYNIVNHQFVRSPLSILYLREDTLSQLLTLCNVRPGGRYLVVDDTGGLVTAALLERMGATGRILTLTDADSPPAWGVLNTMNFSARELSCIKHLSWLQSEEDYEPQPLPNEADLPTIAAPKTHARQRRHMFQVAELNATRDELYRGGWDGLIMSTELNPLSVLARLSPYLGGSATVTVYSQHQQALAETLQYCKQNPSFISPNLTESLTRTYQVLPGRTHPLMTTSATGGYLLHALKVYPGKSASTAFAFERRKIAEQRKRKKAEHGKAAEESSADAAEAEVAEEEDISEEVDGVSGTREATADDDVDLML